MGALKQERLKHLLAEFGRLGLIIYFILFALVLMGFVLAIQMGFKTESTAGKAGIWGAAWLATKVTQPLRILATLALTPIVAHVLKRSKKQVTTENINGSTPPSP
jgi:cytochrome b561